MRFVASGWVNVRPQMQVSGAFKTRTGMAIDPIASGLDLNGDGRFGDRTPTFARNAFRGPGSNSVDVRVTWTVPLGGQQRLQFYAEAFNVLNTENVRTLNNDYGPDPSRPNSRWLEPVTYFPPREIQFGARLAF